VFQGEQVMDDIIDRLEDLIGIVNNFAESIEAMRDDLKATIRDCEQLAEEVEQLREAAGK
jgi:polyhydroxyalkanoate synthesis regulator phasin